MTPDRTRRGALPGYQIYQYERNWWGFDCVNRASTHSRETRRRRDANRAYGFADVLPRSMRSPRNHIAGAALLMTTKSGQAA